MLSLSMKLVLFRHADKSHSPPGDPALTEFGNTQALQIAAAIGKSLPQPDLIFSSPKLRAQQTLTPSAALLGKDIQVLSLLNERKYSESPSSFIDRVSQFSKSLSMHPEKIIFAVSHYDWVAQFCLLATCDINLDGEDFQHWQSAQYLILEGSFDAGFRFIQKGRFP